MSTPHSHVRQLLQNTLWALRYSWHTSRGLTTVFMLSSALGGILPAGLVITMRGLINALSRSPSPDWQRWLTISLMIALAEALALLAYKYYRDRLAEELNIRINTQIMQHSSRLDLALFESSDFRDRLARAQDGMALRFARFLEEGVGIVNGTLQISLLLAVLMLIDPLVVAVVAMLAPPYVLFTALLARHRFATEYTRATRKRWTEYYVSRLTSHEQAAEVRLLGLAPHLIDQFRSIMADFRNENRRFDRLRLFGGLAFFSLALICLYLILVRVVGGAVSGEVPLGDVAVFVAAVARLAKTAESTSQNAGVLLERVLDVSMLRAFFEIEPQQARSGGITPVSAQGRIELQNIWFTYPGGSQPTLSELSLTIEPGETVALVGENGAGKTTLAKLIARIYDVDRGRVLFDGKDVRDLSVEFLHRQIAFVFQQVGRYEATAADNIAYGDLSHLLHERDAVIDLARFAQIDAMIRQMPDGYDTRLGRLFGDYEPSGGQWQMIAIARAFARDGSLLILDEPSANLDARAESELFRRFRELARGKTTLLISHRFSTVSMADRILVLNDGTVCEQGTHAQLLALNGHYAQLFRLQQTTS